MRKYTIERTCRTTKSDGTDTYVTCEIVTDHSTAFVMCTNNGNMFTVGKDEPSEGKKAMVNRTFALFARDQAEKSSTDAEFERHMQDPEVDKRIKDFRLLTTLTAFCRLAMKGCPWMQPDLSYAKQIWAQGDKMLKHEYLQPMPEPRRMSRRAEICTTQAILESVARVYM